MTIRTTRAQLDEIRRSLVADNRWWNEKVWTYLVADILANSPNSERYVQMLCGGDVVTGRTRDVWFEAQPMGPRKGTRDETESNTTLDLALGDVCVRGNSAAGIAYSKADTSWTCFVEAKVLSDCSADVTHDPLRNQLTRVIECVLCFQSSACFPDKVFFTLLTPRLFRDNPMSRLYGYKFREYEQDRRRILDDIARSRIPRRIDLDWKYPDLERRLDALRLSWVTYEEILEPELGASIDVVEIAMTARCPSQLEDRFRSLALREPPA